MAVAHNQLVRPLIKITNACLTLTIYGFLNAYSATAQADDANKAEQNLQNGAQFLRSGDFQAALIQFKEAFNVFCGEEEFDSFHRAYAQYIPDIANCINSAGNLGITYSVLGNHSKASNYFRVAAVIGDFTYVRDYEEITWQENLSFLDFSLFESASFATAPLDFTPRMFDNLGSRAANISYLERQDIGDLYLLWGEYERAIRHYESILGGYGEELSLQDRVRALNNLGLATSYSGGFDHAESLYRAALELAESIGEVKEKANILGNIGVNFYFSGSYTQSILYHLQSLDIHRSLDSTIGVGNSLNNLAAAHSALGYYETALENLEESLVTFESIDYLYGQSSVLSNMGVAYFALGQNAAAIRVYREGLSISRELGSQQIQANLLNNLGISLQETHQYGLSSDAFQKSLSLLRQIGDRRGAGINYGNIGRLYEQRMQPELAILFYKQSVEIHETVRQDITNRVVLQSYTHTISETYRRLASLLLAQGRIPEAQQVLDLLKLEELREFTDTRATWTSEGIQYTKVEEPVIDAHGSLIALGSTLIECERTNCANLGTLTAQQESLLAQYDTEVARFTEAVQAGRRDDDIFQNPDNVSGDAQKLLETYTAAGQTPVLIYPFVLEDKLWLVWVTVGDVIGSVEVPVTQGQLSTTVQRFGELLQNRNSDIHALQAESKQLYDWIIRPLAAELEANNIDHLVFVNDRVTRYIPMAALYDGERYLAERYTLSTVLAPQATDLDDRLATVETSPVLGLGLTQAIDEFNALPAVYRELTAIVQDGTGEGIYPGQVLLDEAFTLESLKANVGSHRILHMATHAAFVPGRAEESFIVLGDGSRLKIPDIEIMQRRLRNLHLVVLSACQTALGGANQDGTEIAGLSSYFLETNRAKAVLASLWAVSDGSTSLLMQRFYENLATGEYSKAEALRKAQRSFLESNSATADGEQRIIGQRQTEARASVLSHPYFWAPFILIGNGL